MQHEPKPAPLFANAEAARLFWLCAFLLLLASLALNLRVLDFGFLYLRDDDVNVAVNRHMGRINAERLGWMFTDFSYVRRYIPLGWLNFSATYEFAGLDPRPYHAVALALYLANTALVFILVAHALRLFAQPGAGDALGPWGVGAAALAAAWWAAHPFRVETTAWVSGNLYGQSMALLLLASLLAYLRTYGSQGGAPRGVALPRRGRLHGVAPHLPRRPRRARPPCRPRLALLARRARASPSGGCSRRRPRSLSPWPRCSR